MHPLVLLGLLLALGLIVLAAMPFSGRQVTIRPPFLNHRDGDQATTTSDAIASHSADTRTGEAKAAAGVDGNGRGRARAALGHEFQYTGNRRQDFRVSVRFQYRTGEKVTQAPATATGIVNVILAPNSPNYANDVQVGAGQIENPAGGGFTQEVAEFRISLDPNESFIVDVELTAVAEATDALNPGACTADVVARIQHILIEPV